MMRGLGKGVHIMNGAGVGERGEDGRKDKRHIYTCYLPIQLLPIQLPMHRLPIQLLAAHTAATVASTVAAPADRGISLSA